MFGRRYFGGRYYGPRYWGEGGAADDAGDNGLAIFYRRRHRRWWPLPKH